jgi:uncharacterized membrane protein
MNETRQASSISFPTALNNIVCGFLVFATHWQVPIYTGPARENFFATGLAIIMVALATLIAHGQVQRNYWSALNVALGVWLIVSTGLFQLPAGIGWAQGCLGILTVVIALTSLGNERNVVVRR